MNILLVDDERSFLEQTKIFLENQNEDLKIDTFPHADSALEVFDENKYDAIISDYQMPDIDGLDFLKIIRQEKKSEIPFIIFTGKGREDVAMEALNLGADRYLQKGGDPRSQYGVLAQAVVQEIEHAEAQKEIEKLAKYPSENPNPVIRISRDGTILYSNDAGKPFLSKWEVEIEDIVPEDWQKKISNVFKAKESKKCEVKIDEKTYSVTVSPVVDEGYANLYASDITERKKAEKERLETYRDMKETFNSIGEIAFLLDEKHNILMANDEAVEFFDKSRDEIKNNKCFHLSHRTDQPIEGCPLEKTLENNDEHEYEFHDSVRDKHFLARTYPIEGEDDDPEKFVHQLIDITERKKMEKELKEREKKFRSFFENEPEYCYMVSPDGKIIDINKSALNILGYEKEEIKGEPLIYTIYSPSSREKAEELFMTWEKGEKIESEEMEIITKDGERRTVLLSAVSVTDDDGNIQYSVSIQRDITEMKELEDRKETLHSLLRHDVKNKSQVVKGYLELAEDKDIPSEVKDYLDKAENATDESMEIIEKVRVLERAENEEIKEIDLDSILEKNEKRWIEKGNEKGMDIDIEHPENDIKIQAGSLVYRIFSNIIENSLEHSEGDMISVNIDDKDDEVVCSICDDGSGISDEEKNKIFEKGYTTDDERGTGLGLYLVQKLIEIYGGKIEVKDSELGGARFDIYFKKA